MTAATRSHEPVLLAGNDADDGLWELVIAAEADGSTGKIGHLHHAIDEDPTPVDVLDLPPDQSASRFPAAYFEVGLILTALRQGSAGDPVGKYTSLTALAPSSKRSPRNYGISRHTIPCAAVQTGCR